MEPSVLGAERTASSAQGSVRDSREALLSQLRARHPRFTLKAEQGQLQGEEEVGLKEGGYWTGGALHSSAQGSDFTKAQPLLSLRTTCSHPSFLTGSRLQEDRALARLIQRQQAPEPLGTKSVLKNFCWTILNCMTFSLTLLGSPGKKSLSELMCRFP